jgi:single-strand DNA-binding protein
MSAQVTIVGNLTRDPELRYTPSGQANVKFGVAVNRRTKKDGEWVDADPSFFDVVCWRDLAENVSDSLSKGTRVVVTGRLEQRSWEQDGQKRYAVEIVADEVAPSLRWATAQVVKAERAGGGAQPAPPAPAGDFGDEPF